MKLYCPVCKNDIIKNNIIEDRRVVPMSNGVKIITPICAKCGTRIKLRNIESNISNKHEMYLVSGPCASGKSTIGKYIQQHYPFVFLDGDAISKRVNYDIRSGIINNRSGYLCHEELLDTALILNALGSSVFMSYVVNEQELLWYRKRLEQYSIDLQFFVLLPERSVCIKRDMQRECWTAGEEYIDKWYGEQKLLVEHHPGYCINNGNECVEKTVEKILSKSFSRFSSH